MPWLARLRVTTPPPTCSDITRDDLMTLRTSVVASSITKSIVSRSASTWASRRATTLGCPPGPPSHRISRSSRRVCFPSKASLHIWCICLIATASPVSVSIAAHTTPKAPFPRGCVGAYLDDIGLKDSPKALNPEGSAMDRRRPHSRSRILIIIIRMNTTQGWSPPDSPKGSSVARGQPTPRYDIYDTNSP